MTDQAQHNEHAAALAGFKQAAKEITSAQTQLEAANKRIEEVDQLSQAILEELKFIQTEYPNLTIRTKREDTDTRSSVQITLSTGKHTENTRGIPGLKIQGTNGGPVRIYMEIGQATQTYENSKKEKDWVVTQIAHKAAIDDALATARQQTPQTNKKAPTLSSFL